MVELRGVQPPFPLYGTFKLADGRPYSYELFRNHGALVRPELLAQLDLKEGDEVLFGGTKFQIRGVIREEPGNRSGPFSLGSRAVVAYDDLRAAGLLTFGSRARYAILLRVEGESEARNLVEGLRKEFRARFVNVRWYRATEEDIGEDLQRAEDYLSLVGLAMVILGGVGVWSVTRVFVHQKLRSIAVLKCLGRRAVRCSRRTSCRSWSWRSRAAASAFCSPAWRSRRSRRRLPRRSAPCRTG